MNLINRYIDIKCIDYANVHSSIVLLVIEFVTNSKKG